MPNISTSLEFDRVDGGGNSTSTVLWPDHSTVRTFCKASRAVYGVLRLALQMAWEMSGRTSLGMSAPSRFFRSNMLRLVGEGPISNLRM